jgi:stage IV sporulation protein FB
VFDSGYLTLGRFRGAPVRFHWSILAGMLVLTRFRIAPGEWLGFVVVVLVHEIGHAMLVERLGLLLVSIDVHGFGGGCAYSGSPTSRERAIVAWGGIVAQAALLTAVVVVLAVLGWPERGALADLVDALTWSNAGLMALNLLPIAPLDGAEAWRLFPSGRRR